jgi:uncharacterized protein (DUF433 family)
MATSVTWVSKRPGRSGGEACIRDTRITVWGLEALRRAGSSESEIVNAIAGLTASDLDAAWEYVAAHPAEIERAIRENESEDVGHPE